ncbi:MAG: hypothetical protein ACK5A3_22140 [Planctomyces sp.]
MFDRRLDETWILRYRQGLLSAEDELWTESCYDSEQSVRELFGQLRVVPLHLRDEADVEDAEPEVSDDELLERIDEGLRQLDVLVTAATSGPVLSRGRRLPVLLRRGGGSQQGSESTVSAAAAAAAAATAAATASATSAAAPERTAPPDVLSCDYEFVTADRGTIMLRFRGPLGVVRGVEVQVEELQLQGPQQLGCWTFDFQTAHSEDAGERSVQIVLDRPPTTRIAVWVTYLNEL